jgi:hypothetical protein
MSNLTPDPLLTPKELELDPEIRIPQKTSATWRSRGMGPAYIQIGRRVLYRRSDVLTWLDSLRVVPGSRPQLRVVQGGPSTAGRGA